MFAAGNFFLTILLTRYYTDIDLAAYGIALAIALVLQGVQKNTYVIQNSVLNKKIFKTRAAKIIGEHVIAIQPILILLLFLSLIVAVYMEQGLLTHTVIATTVCFSIYSQLEFERIVFIKFDKYIVPFITSFVFLTLIIGFIFLHSELTFYEIMLFLLLFAATKTLMMFFIVGSPDIKGGWRLLQSDFRCNAMGSLLGVIGASGYTHGPVMALGVLSSPTQVAAYVAMRSLMQPTQIIMRSLDVIDKNIFHAKAVGTAEGIKKTMMSQIKVYLYVSSIISFLICIFGKEIIHLLYAGKHENYIWVLYGWGILSVFMAIVLPLESAIIIQKKLNEYNHQRLWIGIVTVILSVLFAGMFGASGIVIISLAAGILAFISGHYIVKNANKKLVNNNSKKNYNLITTGYDEKIWNDVIKDFSDASIYQTCAYGMVRWGKKNVEQAILKYNDEILAASLVITKHVPFIPLLKVSYIPRGPMVYKKSNNLYVSEGIIPIMLEKLKQEYSFKRGCLLRISLNQFEEYKIIKIIQKIGFKPVSMHKQQRTFILDLEQSSESIRKNFDKTWRSSLSKAERSNLIVEHGTGMELYASFSEIYKKMLDRKKFRTGVDYKEFAKLQELLPENQKMRVLICYQDGIPVNAAVVSAIGSTAVYLMGATNNQYKGVNGSYLLQWHIIGWLKNNGFKYYDLGGVDIDSNPNVYRFKKGIVGNKVNEIKFISIHEVCHNKFTYISLKIFEKIKKILGILKFSIGLNKVELYTRIKRYFQKMCSTSFFKTTITIPNDFRALTVTFDDFPKSSLLGAKILEEFNGHGTFYVCMGLFGKESQSGTIANLNDVIALYNSCHEIGCHTYEHIDCSLVSAVNVENSCKNNIKQASNIGISFENFAYPKGRASLNAKRKLKNLYNSARGNKFGINKGKVDIYLLKANPIYEDLDHSIIFNYLNKIVKSGGWLILYTHDVSENPSKYGTSEKYLRSILEECKSNKIPIMSVSEVLKRINNYR